ncbi:MAG: DNA-3-methyladenine glycosylase I [Anaerolineaceae bacterium]|nr:DNA-3-methyladenine glycosylase I [Anaerolineaceae bacterium]
MKRCEWTQNGTKLMIAYHGHEGGVPQHNDQTLIEFLILEGAQAGLSWITILYKRQHYRAAFDRFDLQKIVLYDEDKLEALLLNPGIVRNRRKVYSVVQNACAFLEVQSEFGSFDAFIWSFTDGRTLQNKWKTMSELPTQTEASARMSKELKRRGFNFVGPTICYAFMQAVGMVNDHTIDCYRYEELNGKSELIGMITL